eukprot:1201105-Pyramimonas_sp.AAC.1
MRRMTFVLPHNRAWDMGNRHLGCSLGYRERALPPRSSLEVSGGLCWGLVKPCRGRLGAVMGA